MVYRPVKFPKDSPENVGDRVELRGRGHKGEVTCFYHLKDNPKLSDDCPYIFVNVAWDWEACISDNPPAWGWVDKSELKKIG